MCSLFRPDMCWQLFFNCPDALKNPSEARARRSQRDYSLPFESAVVGEVGCGELSYKQARWRYGIQGRSTVLTWCRRYAISVNK